MYSSPDGMTDRQGVTHVLVVDRHPLTRGALCDLLAGAAGDLATAAAASPDQAAAMAGQRKAGLIVYNANQCRPEEEPVASDLAALRDTLPDWPVALLTLYDGETVSPELARRLGLRGQFALTFATPVLAAAIRLIVAGGSYFPPGDAARQAPPIVAQPSRDAADLTRRETEVLHKLCQGKANKLIAYELDMSENTVKVHVYRIMKKLRAANRTEVVSIMQGQGGARALGNPSA